MVHDHFSISDTDGTLLDLSDLLNVELKSGSVQSFDTRWDETIIEMTKKTDDEVQENLLFRQLHKADKQKQFLALYIQDSVQKAGPKKVHHTEKKGGPLRVAEDTSETFLIS